MLSDELLAIGSAANPKNNLSCGEAADKMFQKLKDEQAKGEPMKRLFNVVSLVCEILQKEEVFHPNVL